MVPVYQNIFEVGQGDCFSACIASLLGLPLCEVPSFKKEHGTDANVIVAAREWLSIRGFSLVIQTGVVTATRGTLCIGVGESANHPGLDHAVVGTVDEYGKFRMVHDPNPLGRGIVGQPKWLHFLVPVKELMTA